jgi:hypothetical protein
MPRVPNQEPPSGEGGGAAERLRQFEQARGWKPDTADEEVSGEGSQGHDNDSGSADEEAEEEPVAGTEQGGRRSANSDD